MYIEVMDKIDNIINELDKTKTIQRMMDIKKEIDKNKEVKRLIEIFKEAQIKNNKNNLIESKKNLYNHPLIKEYIALSSELEYFIMYFNHKLAEIIGTKKCQNPT
jgi:cell fate (sporulation/competence/biofilm development) regulator YlbF (YheA/YmcA/DUF963 family)